MVTNVTSLTGNGLKDWLIQRVSAIYLAGYVFWLLGYFIVKSPVDYHEWHALFHYGVVQIATVLTLFFILLHAWIGIWTVTTDYLKQTTIRILIQVLVALFLSGQFLWGLMIIWGQS